MNNSSSNIADSKYITVHNIVRFENTTQEGINIIIVPANIGIINCVDNYFVTS